MLSLEQHKWKIWGKKEDERDEERVRVKQNVLVMGQQQSRKAMFAVSH